MQIPPQIKALPESHLETDILCMAKLVGYSNYLLKSVAVGTVVFPRNLQTCTRSTITILGVRSIMEPPNINICWGLTKPTILSPDEVYILRKAKDNSYKWTQHFFFRSISWGYKTITQSCLVNIGNEVCNANKKNDEHVDFPHQSLFGLRIDNSSRNIIVGKDTQSDIAVVVLYLCISPILSWDSEGEAASTCIWEGLSWMVAIAGGFQTIEIVLIRVKK